MKWGAAETTVYALWGYKPVVKPAIQWIRCADGNYRATDRGISEDVYEANIVFKGPESEMIGLAQILDGERTNFQITCGKGEEIFGADINHAIPLDVIVVRYGQMKRVSFSEYSVPLTLRLRNINYVGTPSLSSLRLRNWNYTADSDYNITKLFSYDNGSKYISSNTDFGFFRASFRQTFEEMKSIRRYLLTTARTAAISFPTQCGIPYPFGYRKGPGPFTCKVVKWDDGGRPEYNTANLKIDFAMELS